MSKSTKIALTRSGDYSELVISSVDSAAFLLIYTTRSVFDCCVIRFSFLRVASDNIVAIVSEISAYGTIGFVVILLH